MAHHASTAGHDTSLPYADQIVPGAAVDTTGWTWWFHRDQGTVHYYTKGPCPGCHAEAQGHHAAVAAPIEGQGSTEPTAPPGSAADQVKEVTVGCFCGDDHGHPGAPGCGRRWSIIGPSAPAH